MKKGSDFSREVLKFTKKVVKRIGVLDMVVENSSFYDVFFLVSVGGMYREKPFKILGTSPLLAHALSNAWDRPDLGTRPAREHDDEHFHLFYLQRLVARQSENKECALQLFIMLFRSPCICLCFEVWDTSLSKQAIIFTKNIFLSKTHKWGQLINEDS
jgi:hypothetical protein